MKLSKITLVMPLICVVLFINFARSQSESESALIRRQAFGNPPIWRLTKGVTNASWGIDLFGRPRASAQDYIYTPSDELWTGVSFQIDYDWSRMLYLECLDNWIKAQGSHGSGTNQFYHPRSIDVTVPNNESYFSYIYYIFVLEQYNNRISRFVYDWDYQTMNENGHIGLGYLYNPIDMDLNNNFNFWPHSDDYLWIMDGTMELKRMGIDGQFYAAYGSSGCDGDVWTFCQPTAVVSGRSNTLSGDYDPYANTDHLYVSDPGNNRIVWLIKTHGWESVTWYAELPTDPSSYIIDLETDNFGQLWALDNANDQVIKYTYDLFLLCKFGGTGIGNTEFIRPVNIRNTGGFRGCGNMYILESWSDTTGGNYFCIGTDIVDLSVISTDNRNIHHIYFVLVDPSKLNIKIFDQNQMEVRELLDGLYLAGEFPILWDGTDNNDQQVPTGDYRLVITDTCSYFSRYTGEPANVVIKEYWFHHIYCNNGECDYLCGDANGDGTIDILDNSYIIAYLYQGGPPPEPEEAADINCDGKINILDITYLVGYLYQGGPVPCANCYSK